MTNHPSPQSKPRVIVLHALRPTSRQTTIDHLLSFREHLPHADVQYLHFQQPIPKELTEDLYVDLLIVNYDYLNYRFSPLWPYIKKRHLNIARQAKNVVAIAQDDFWANKLLDNWCMEWDVDRILTPIDTDRDVLYPRSIKTKEFRTGLTGYVKSGPTPVTRPLAERPLDLGQRVRDMPPHLGRLAQAKATQAVAMAEAAKEARFVVDVSTRVEDSFIGTAWFDFLASCKFTVGMKGGASLHDPYGLIHTKVQSYRARHPEASFDEIEKHCFKGKDMKHEFTAISPRLFESAMAGTCQILQRDDYLGVLEPWRDYIPLEADLSNMKKVLDVMRDIEHCQEIVSNSQRALIDSKVFDYSQLVTSVTEHFLGETSAQISVRWSEFVSAKAFSEWAFTTYGADLHDACLNYLTETVSGTGSTNTAVVQTLNSYLNGFAGKDWLTAMSNQMKNDQLTVRSPWIWRPLTSHVEKI